MYLGQHWTGRLFMGFRKGRLNPQFMNRLNQHAEVMAEHLTEDLIELPDIAFTPYRIPKLGLDHTKGRLDVRPLVIREL